jgi:hypothetical protein
MTMGLFRKYLASVLLFAAVALCTRRHHAGLARRSQSANKGKEK